MADIVPFRALRFDERVVGDLGSVVCPPYDVISGQERTRLERRSRFNAVRLVLPQPEDGTGDERYRHARHLLDDWRATGALREDAEASFTVYEQRAVIDGASHVQRGILAAVSLEEPHEGGVFPHERTYGHIIEDRLRLLRATETNLDCIMCVYEGDDGEGAAVVERATGEAPLSRFTTPDDGTEHALWRLADAGSIRALQRTLERAAVVIADGHHRWTTARRYRDERRATDGRGPWDQQLMLLIDANHAGPALLPIHRVLDGLDPDEVVERLKRSCRVEEAVGDDLDRLAADLASPSRPQRRFAMAARGRAWWVTPDADAERRVLPSDRSAAWRGLDVAVLHVLVFEHLLGGAKPRFVHHPSEVAAELDSGRASVAFLLAPMSFSAVRAVSEAGEAMPQKSTFFVPKPSTGIALRRLA